MKNFVIKVLGAILTATLCCCLFVACNSNEKPNDNQTTITLSADEITLKLYEQYTLEADVTGSTAEVAWHSSDASVVSVQQGVLSANKAGVVTITATVGSAVDTCNVTVVETGAVPVLSVNRKKVEISQAGKIYLEAAVTLDGIEVDADIAWNSADPSIATAEPTARGAMITGGKVGTTTVTATAEFNGTPMQATVEVVVKDNVSFEIDNLDIESGAYSCTLYRSEPLPEYEGKNSVLVEFTLEANGSALPQDSITLREESNNNILSIDGKRITATGTGKTKVYAEYKSEAGVPYCLQINVNVMLPTVWLNDNLIQLEKTAESVSFEKDARIQGEVVSVSVEGFELFSKVESGNVYLQKAQTAKVSGGYHELSLDTDLIEYRFNSLFITDIITTKEELLNFPTLAYAESDKDYVWGGYFVLGNDIEFNGIFKGFCNYTQCGSYLTGTPDTLGFVGTFDGQGHTINNISFTNDQSEGASFISLLGAKGVLKNIAFTNVAQTAGGGCVVSSCYGTVENVFVEGVIDNTLTWSGSYSTLLVSDVADVGTVKNCVAILSGTGSEINNYETKAEAIEIAIKTAKENALIENVQAVGVVSNYSNLSGVSYYENIQALANAKNTIAGNFGEEWDVSESVRIPMLKNMRAAIIAQSNLLLNQVPAIVYPGSEYAIPEMKNLSLVSDSLPNGVTLNGNVLQISSSAAETSFDLKWQNGYYTNLSISKTFSIKNVVSVSGYLCDVDMSASADALIDLTKISSYVSGSTVTGLYINGTDMSGKYTQTGDTLTIANGDLTGFTVGEKDIVLIVDNNGDSAAYKATLTLATLIIDSWEKFASFYEYAEKPTSLSWDGHFIVSADIDGNGATFYAFCNWYYGSFDSTNGFIGTFDGRGHIISNFQTGNNPTVTTGVSHANIFSNIGAKGVVKNVCFAEVTKNGTASLLASNCWGTIENVFTGGYLMGAGSGNDAATMLVTNLKSGATVRNCAMYIKWKNGSYIDDTNIALLYATREDGVTIENVHAMGSLSTNLIIGELNPTIEGVTKYVESNSEDLATFRAVVTQMGMSPDKLSYVAN